MARKIPEGEFRNKERTKLKLIQAVGVIIRTEGYTKLGVNRIADTAGVSKKLIYRYFGNADKLIETYVKGEDYWMMFSTSDQEPIEESVEDQGQAAIARMLKSLYEHLESSPEARKIIVWEISEKSQLMKEVSQNREKFGAPILAQLDAFFDSSDIDIRGILSLLLGGIYYINLHSNSTGGNFCEIENQSEERKKRIFKSLEAILEWTYEEAGKQKTREKTPSK
ncbi:TetR family transcriptional regulator [Echinicola pacifica]|uniref:TetR family transcriptional regulator n=1 Tax=Echinicola pacifica TaxID=346377 RepID=A0A918UP06_9BACT|nr:TetR/AcrR family transcriptional regulator [Echinicola pacifica]GGZ23773.1 TetR family transcriptional regulator [Echinicola pacifica]